jgi:hypothetical protein
MCHEKSDVQSKYKVINSIQRDREWIYLVSDEDNEIFLKHCDKKQSVTNNIMTQSEVSVISIVFGIIALICAIVVTVGTISNDDEIGWNTHECIMRVRKNLIKCEYENGYYYYILNGRLLGRSERNMSQYDVECICRQFGKSPNLFPKFKSTSNNREYKLNKLLS